MDISYDIKHIVKLQYRLVLIIEIELGLVAHREYSFYPMHRFSLDFSFVFASMEMDSIEVMKVATSFCFACFMAWETNMIT